MKYSQNKFNQFLNKQLSTAKMYSSSHVWGTCHTSNVQKLRKLWRHNLLSFSNVGSSKMVIVIGELLEKVHTNFEIEIQKLRVLWPGLAVNKSIDFFHFNLNSRKVQFFRFFRFLNILTCFMKLNQIKLCLSWSESVHLLCKWVLSMYNHF